MTPRQREINLSIVDLPGLVARRAVLAERLGAVLAEIVTVARGLSLAAEIEAREPAAEPKPPQVKQAMPRAGTRTELSKLRQKHVASRTERITSALDGILGSPAYEEGKLAGALTGGQTLSAREIARKLIAGAGFSSGGMPLEDALMQRARKVLEKMRASGKVSRESGGKWKLVPEAASESDEAREKGPETDMAAVNSKADEALGSDGGRKATQDVLSGGDSLTVREIASRILGGSKDAVLLDAATWRVKTVLAAMEASGEAVREGQRMWKLPEGASQ